VTYVKQRMYTAPPRPLAARIRPLTGLTPLGVTLAGAGRFGIYATTRHVVAYWVWTCPAPVLP
jgi:hypothetical protein